MPTGHDICCKRNCANYTECRNEIMENRRQRVVCEEEGRNYLLRMKKKGF